MKINVDVKMLNMNGVPVNVEQDPKKPAQHITLQTVLIQSLMSESEDKKIDGKTRIERYDIALKIKDGGEVELTNAELSKMQELVMANYSTLIAGQVNRLLEGKESGLEKKNE